MAERYEYQVCQSQSARVTFVNGVWMGSVDPAASEHNAALNSCPLVWDYLQEAGREGWELVAAATQPTAGDSLEKLYLKRGY
jgi:hypothetical protein